MFLAHVNYVVVRPSVCRLSSVYLFSRFVSATKLAVTERTFKRQNSTQILALIMCPLAAGAPPMVNRHNG